MSQLAGFLGPGDWRALGHLLGKGAQVEAGSGFGLGLKCGGAEPGTLTRANGGLSASVGRGPEAGASATFGPAGNTLVLATDPFGFYTLYTTEVGRVVWFASDLRLLLKLPAATNQVDAAGLHGYLCFSYVPTPQTLFAGIRALPAGTRLTLRPGAAPHQQGRAAWCEQPQLAITEAGAVEQLRSLLREAVARQLGRTSETGVYLSGGLDSSLIAALLAEAGVRLHLFTLDFGPPFDGELAYACRVAEHLGRPLHVVPARPADIRSALAPTAAALHQPFGDGVVVPLYLLGRAAAQQVSTVFTGEGGDQLFGGWTNKPMIAAELYATPSYSREEAYLQTYHRLYGLSERFYTAPARQLVAHEDAGQWVRPALNAPGFASLLHRLRAANLWLKGAQNITPRVNQLAAAHALALRAPFFDRELAAWTFALPPEWFLRGAQEKYLLKRAAEPFLPAEVIWRSKRGMGVPTTEWCLASLRREVGRWLNPRRLKQAGWFEPAAIARLRRGEALTSDVRQRRIGEVLWLLVILHVWVDVHAQHLSWLPTVEGGAS